MKTGPARATERLRQLLGPSVGLKMLHYLTDLMIYRVNLKNREKLSYSIVKDIVCGADAYMHELNYTMFD